MSNTNQHKEENGKSLWPVLQSSTWDAFQRTQCEPEDLENFDLRSGKITVYSRTSHGQGGAYTSNELQFEW